MKGKMKSAGGRERGQKMCGYYSSNGFWGLVDGKYRLFASEEDYYDIAEDGKEDAA